MAENILIEFFDHESMENIISLTGGRYSRIVYFWGSGVATPELSIASGCTSREKTLTARFFAALAARYEQAKAV